MSRILFFIKELKKEILEIKRQFQIYMFLQRYIARSRFLNDKAK